MHLVKAVLATMVGGVFALAAAPSAHAQAMDFATCGTNLVQCDPGAGVKGCCYRTFDPVASDRAIVIPLDRCHQRLASAGKLGPPDAAAPAWCTGTTSGSDNGMFQAYGLVYRLMQAGIPVYWAINPSKDPPALTNAQNAGSQTYIPSDIDFWVVSQGASQLEGVASLNSCAAGCTPPVLRLNPNTLSPISSSYSAQEFPVRGGAFIIAAEDRPAFNAWWNNANSTGLALWDFTDVDLYEVQPNATFVYQDFTTSGPSYSVPQAGTVPVAVTIDYKPPRVARQSPAGVSELWLDMAKLKQPANPSTCKTGTFSPPEAVYCDITESDIQAGVLVNGDFQWAWIDNWSDNSPCANAAEQTQHQKLDEFMAHQPGIRAGGHVLYMEAAVGVVESCPNLQFQGTVGAGPGLVPSTSAIAEPLILRYPANLFQQWGDVPTEFAQGGSASWYYYTNGANGYDPLHLGGGSLVRLVSQDRSAPGNALCTAHKSTPGCDVFAMSNDADYLDTATYARHKADPSNGLAFYLGGNQVNNNPSHLRMILNALIALPVATVPQVPTTTTEVSRSSAIVADVDGTEAQYQGTYELELPRLPASTYSGGTGDTFRFPHTVGHLRAIDTAAVSNTNTAFDALGGVIFDAADGIPPVNPAGCATPFSPGCRTVFTNTTTGSSPGRVFFDTGNAATLHPYLDPNSLFTVTDAETLISRVLAGHKDSSNNWVPKLGGIDRSTMAIIEQSQLIAKQRPTVIYVGGLDGMLHAICADVLGPCSAKGQELWAFIPRSQLGRLHTNTQRIDGSPKVSDVFADFNGDGTREWHTVLTFQSGSGDPGFVGRTPTVTALDVTDPGAPQILWEVSTPASRGSFELGLGLGLAMGPIKVGSDITHVTFVQTNNGGTAGPGMRVMAYDSATGAEVWSTPFTYLYPAPRSGANPPVPATGIPGGVAAYDRLDTGSITEVAVPTLYGDLFILDATDGSNRYGSVPLFRFDTDFHPIGAAPTIFVDRSTGKMHAVVVSGGYADPVNSSWAPSTENQYAVAVHLDAPVGVAPMGHTGSNYGGERLFVVDLGVGQRAFSQAVVAGNELFITTDSGDVNAAEYGTTSGTGQLTRFNLSGGTPPVYFAGMAGGASSADVNATGVAHIGSGDGARKVDVSSNFDADGRGVELAYRSASGRKLWLRLR